MTAAQALGTIQRTMSVRSINGGNRMRWRRRGEKATFNGDLVISSRALRFTAALGTTDDARIHNITQALPASTPTCLPPQRAGHYQAATQQVAANCLARIHLRANNSRRAARSPSCEYHWPMTC
ncbi:hypothetical protein AB0G64_19760 [Streptomyces longwoodensis]|uniref:hypothetical protein n=1 Tax=Streptomyces longwoodensis TaxID=68231 RepID=UPI0033C3D2FE